MRYSALVLAAGSGQRMKLGYNKVFYELENGKTVLDQALSVFKDVATRTAVAGTNTAGI